MIFLVKTTYSYLGSTDVAEEVVDVLDGSRESACAYCREMAKEFSDAGYDVNIVMSEANIIKLC